MPLASIAGHAVTKEGVLSKLGGGAGGHKNWKDRFFVLSDHVYYYNSKRDFEKDPTAALGRVNLAAYFVAKTDADSFEFTVHAYPKVSEAKCEAIPCAKKQIKLAKRKVSERESAKRKVELATLSTFLY